MTRAMIWLTKRLSNGRLRLLGWSLTLLFIGIFTKVTWELHEDSAIGSWDQKILLLISTLRTAPLNGAMVDLTALGSPTLITLFSVVVILFLALDRDWRSCFYLATGTLGAGLGVFLTKNFFTRVRPMLVPRLVEVSGFSYPSGHSFAATSFYLLVMFLAWRRYPSWRAKGILFAATCLLILSICFSRLYLGVHYPSDVASGICLGAAWSCLLTAWIQR